MFLTFELVFELESFSVVVAVAHERDLHLEKISQTKFKAIVLKSKTVLPNMNNYKHLENDLASCYIIHQNEVEKVTLLPREWKSCGSVDPQ